MAITLGRGNAPLHSRVAPLLWGAAMHHFTPVLRRLYGSAVAEAGVTGQPDELRGEVIAAFIVLRNGFVANAALRQALFDVVRTELGPIAVIGALEFVTMLPKTRSGKIMRRVLRAVTQGKDPGDITTIEDEGSVDEARQAWQHLRAAVQQ